MLAEFSVIPVGVGVSLSEHVSRSLRIVVESGLDYRLNPMGTVVEGGYDEVMSVIRRCHEAVMADSERVITTVRIDDRRGATSAIEDKVRSVEARLGQELKR
jgi:uncharacterized protein (TIGR00106 family)